MAKTKKRILLFVILAAVVLVLGIVLWLTLGRDAPSPLEAMVNQKNGEVIQYTVAEGMSQEEAQQSLPPPMASFTPPEDWKQILDGAEHAGSYSMGYVDQYLKEEEGQYTALLTFSQRYAVAGETVEAGQEVRFGDLQVIYRQQQESDSSYTTQADWVEGKVLYTLSCKYGAAMELDEMLELVSLVNPQKERQPVFSPLTLSLGEETSFQIGNTRYSYGPNGPCSIGNPEIPADAACVGFSQTPEGYVSVANYEEGSDSGAGEEHTWTYQKEDDIQDKFTLHCRLGSNYCDSYGNPTGGFGVGTEDNVLDASISGNAALVCPDQEQSWIIWIDGCRTYAIITNTPWTTEQLVALAEQVG